MEVSRVEGAVAWAALASRSPAAVFPFYRERLHWEVAGGESATFDYFTSDGYRVALVHQQTAAARSVDAAPHWTVIFTVRDLQQTINRATRLGAALLRFPFQIGEGIVAPMVDPSGISFAIWESSGRGSETRPSPNGSVRMLGAQLRGPEGDLATSFYAGLFRWSSMLQHERQWRSTDRGVVSWHADASYTPAAWIPCFASDIGPPSPIDEQQRSTGGQRPLANTS